MTGEPLPLPPEYGTPSKIGGVWCLRPSKVMAWTSLPVDATRFRVAGG